MHSPRQDGPVTVPILQMRRLILEGAGLSTPEGEAEKPGLRFEIDFKVRIQGLGAF